MDPMSAKPRLLDLFCGAGGAARGYQLAGFEVFGVDIVDQPRYCGEGFVRDDALEFLRDVVSGHAEPFSAVHASPPCQAHTTMSNRWRGKGGKADEHVDLIGETRELLEASGLPWIMENVAGARVAMRSPVTLHGGMFGLGVHRPRLFESNVLLYPAFGRPPRDPVGVYGERPDGRTLWRRRDGSRQRAAASLGEARAAMSIDWMEWRELAEAIPPAFTLHLGEQLMRYVEGKAA